MKKLLFLSGMLFFGSMSFANANTVKITKLETIEIASTKLITYTINDPELGKISISVPEYAINNSSTWWDIPVYFTLDNGKTGMFCASGNGSAADFFRALKATFGLN
jgi:hypothetical protein